MTTPITGQAADAMRVVRDPVSGELRAPTAAEAAAFDKAEAALRASKEAAKGGSSRAPAAPVEIQHPNGAVERTLGEDSQMYSVVTAAPDGSLAFDCLPAKAANAKVKATKNKHTTTKTAAKPAKDGHAH